MKNGNDYYNEGTGFIQEKSKFKWNPIENPLILTGNVKEVPPSLTEKIVRSLQFWKSEKKNNDNFLEIPFKYYVGNTFVENKIKFYTKPASVYFKPAILIIKVVSSLPLPTGLVVIPDIHPYQLNDNIISHFKIEYNGPETIIFVKEFNEKLADFELIESNLFPFYIGKEGSCYKLSGENNNGPEKQECGLEIYQFRSIFKESKKNSLTKTKPAVINLPDDEVATLGMLFEGKMSQINLIKRYIVNREWMPVNKKPHNNGNWCGSFDYHIEKPVKVQKKEDYLKDSIVNYPTYDYKDEDLICLNSNDYY